MYMCLPEILFSSVPLHLETVARLTSFSVLAFAYNYPVIALVCTTAEHVGRHDYPTTDKVDFGRAPFLFLHLFILACMCGREYMQKCVSVCVQPFVDVDEDRSALHSAIMSV